ncbi:glycoside hydrolase family 16 protein [Mycena floridula]|nr:glycoside hydrolase family 16 protein [Mycena floridula]
MTTKMTTSMPTSTVRVYKETDMYQGQDFLDQWDFFYRDDPTHGSVNYQMRELAIAKGLAVVDPLTNIVTLSVDDFSTLPAGTYRDSVRISTKKQYTGGLFISDFVAMPYGCSTWPAYWSVGPNWPNAGEIDVLEGVHNSATNQQTLHTSPGCTAINNSAMTGSIVNADCAIGTQNLGCGVLDSSTTSYGAGFNKAGGGVMAHLWDETGIKIWHFPRNSIPYDITIGKPHPQTWGIPVSFFQNSACDISSHFNNHVLVINTALCSFVNVKWKINYVAVYN